MPILADQRVQPLEQVRRGVRVGEVEHVLVARGGAAAPLGAEHPVRVRADQVGVEVDHLRLDPQPELHAQARARARRAGAARRATRPSSTYQSPRPAVSSRRLPEPAVVEHEALDADRGRRVGQAREPVEVVVEVDGLPGVEHERARVVAGGRGRAAGSGAGGADSPSRPSRGVHEHHVGRGVGLPRAPGGPRRAAAARRRRGRRRGCRRPRAAARRGARGRRSTPRGPPRPRRCGSRSRASRP